MHKRTILALLVVCLMLSAATGCRRKPEPVPQPEPTATTEPTKTPEPELETTTVRVYLVRDEKVGVAGREVQVPDSVEAKAKAAMTELLKGPDADDKTAGLGTAIPEGTHLNGLTIEGGIATVDLEEGFESGGGSLSMQLRVAQVVYTLTQFDEVREVAFRIGGKPVSAIGGEGVIVDPPVDRADFEDVTPAILVDRPLPGERVTSPLRAGGTSNTFEATHQIRLLDAQGEVLAETFVTATSGTGTRGTWEQELEFFSESGGAGTLRVFESSAEDGRPINVVEVPVVLGD